MTNPPKSLKKINQEVIMEDHNLPKIGKEKQTNKTVRNCEKPSVM